ncbi:MBL fold metallo-hydrolase [Microlunatus panaciterrae]|uniref:Ribonuclease BN (tRNA processing enzyme) n=1 Tax=Microlunatus panaciterrae TaxID=400768 RepID=A0ABS2RLC5_9ACTN|nr:MBL fold metallo-hydrolase [Microlunatus panaciterrae]MBM7799814.1 ribonuclease BN (tRNA processing enzyme) [Microlunatus panaciterrae]
MELTIVGCSGSMSGPESPASCYLVQAPYQGRTFTLVLDLGPGAAGALYRYLDPRQVDAIALSHLHPDHCLDLCAFYVAARYSSTAPWPPASVYGPDGTPGRLTRAYDVPSVDGAASEAGPGIGGYFRYQVWLPEQRIGPFIVRTVRVAHPVEAYAIRVEEAVPGGGSLVFSGDTGPCQTLVELSRDVDLLLCESAFLDGDDLPTGLHLCGRQAAEHAEAAGASVLLLTHIPPWNDPEQVLKEAQPHFAGSVQLAEVGARWTIGEPQAALQ